MKIKVNKNPSEKALDVISETLGKYNEKFWKLDCTTYLVTCSEQDEPLGGVAFNIVGLRASVDYTWTEPAHRGKGIGAKLMEEVEKIAIKNGCKIIDVATYGFQAKPFYEKSGYKVVYIQENNPKDHTLYYLEKDISRMS